MPFTKMSCWITNFLSAEAIVFFWVLGAHPQESTPVQSFDRPVKTVALVGEQTGEPA